MNYVELKQLSNGDLLINWNLALLKEDGLIEKLKDATYDDFWSEVLEDYLCNGYAIYPEEIVALTDGLIISDGRNYWVDDCYAIRSPYECLCLGISCVMVKFDAT